jgi:hypothetical protein
MQRSEKISGIFANCGATTDFTQDVPKHPLRDIFDFQSSLCFFIDGFLIKQFRTHFSHEALYDYF